MRDRLFRVSTRVYLLGIVPAFRFGGFLFYTTAGFPGLKNQPLKPKFQNIIKTPFFRKKGLTFLFPCDIMSKLSAKCCYSSAGRAHPW